ncbi:alpha/beta hydrolase [soil metagenome]
MAVDSELQPILDLVNSVEQPPPAEDQVDELREQYAALSMAFGAGADLVEVEGLGTSGPQLPLGLRVYRPTTEEPAARGALVFFHGGGWVIGDLDTHDATCRDLCAASGATIISVDYRRAPECRFPTASDEGFRALQWIVDHAVELEIDPQRVAVGGDSAGGHMATVIARRARDEHGPTLVGQILIYPVTDLASDDDRYPSRGQNGEGHLLTMDTMRFFRDSYVPDATQRPLADASPILVEDLSGLPPALVITAEYDPLRDEGEADAQRLQDAGVETERTRYDGAVHMFFQLSSTAIAQRAVTQAAEALRNFLN